MSRDRGIQRKYKITNLYNITIFIVMKIVLQTVVLESIERNLLRALRFDSGQI